MEKTLIAKIEDVLPDTINPGRLKHTLGVVEAAKYLAQKYKENIFDAEIAALLHDFAKDYNEEQLREYIGQHDIIVDNILMKTYELLHGKVGASIARIEFGISNQDILNAIENHTTGRRGMSNLEKIIYLADFIEKGRKYPGVEQLRKLADENLDEAVLMALNNTISYVINTGKLLHPNTLYARNEILYETKNIRGIG